MDNGTEIPKLAWLLVTSTVQVMLWEQRLTTYREGQFNGKRQT